MSTRATDALLGLIAPAWQALFGVCLAVATIVGVVRLAARGPARMTSAMLIAGGLVIAVTLLGTAAVSCSQTNRVATPSDGQRR